MKPIKPMSGGLLVLTGIFMLLMFLFTRHATESAHGSAGGEPVPFYVVSPDIADDGVVPAMLHSAQYDFSFLSGVRDSLQQARQRELEELLRRYSLYTTRMLDERLALNILAWLNEEPLDVSTGILRKRVSRWDSYIEKYACKYNVDPNLVRAIIYAESSGNPNVVSRMGAMGLMQLMPETVDFVGISDPFNPEQNILGGIRYIAWIARYMHEPENARSEAHLLWAWHAGPARTEKMIMPGPTRDFIVKVLAVKQRFATGVNDDPA